MTKLERLLRNDAWLLAACFVMGTLCAWLTVALDFSRYAHRYSDSPVGPLALLGGALAYVGGPVAVARRRQDRRWLALVLVAFVPLAILFWVMVWPDVRGRV